MSFCKEDIQQLLTNSFSIIGTIMGVKYASERGSKEDK
jgi:hypothetical protein